MIHAMACGAFLLKNDHGNLLERAKTIFPHHKRSFYRDVMIRAAEKVHQIVMKEYQKLDYVCVAVDQGSVLGRKNVDFVLESPFSTMAAFPYCTLQITDQTAKGYLPILSQGLGCLELHGIKLGSVVADGNRAQKNVSTLHGSCLSESQYNIHHSKT